VTTLSTAGTPCSSNNTAYTQWATHWFNSISITAAQTRVLIHDNDFATNSVNGKIKRPATAKAMAVNSRFLQVTVVYNGQLQNFITD